MSRKTVAKTPLLLTALCSLQFRCFNLKRINCDSASVNISVFIQPKKHFISEWYFPKNHEIGSFVVRKVKKLWDSRGVQEQLLMRSSCLSPGRVKKLQKFIKSCLKLEKLAMSANLKHSKSTWRQLIVLWKTDKIITSKALGTMHARHFLISERERSIYDSCRFDVGRFRMEPNNYKRCLHPISWNICTSQWPQ